MAYKKQIDIFFGSYEGYTLSDLSLKERKKYDNFVMKMAKKGPHAVKYMKNWGERQNKKYKPFNEKIDNFKKDMIRFENNVEKEFGGVEVITNLMILLNHELNKLKRGETNETK